MWIFGAERVKTRPCVPDRIGIWKCWILRKGENWSSQRKTSQSKEENQQQTLATLHQTQAT